MTTRHELSSIAWLPLITCISLLPITIGITLIQLLRTSVKRFLDLVQYFFFNKRSSTAKCRILLTGAGTPEGLEICRLLHRSGHLVIAADYERIPFRSWTRTSKCIHKFYALSEEGSLIAAGINFAITDFFSSTILHIVERERPDIWIPCGNWPSAESISEMKEKVEPKTSCIVLHPDAGTLQMLTDDAEFAKFVESADAGLTAPEVRTVHSRTEVHRALGGWPVKRRFILQKQEKVPDLQDSPASSLKRRSRHASMASSVSTLTLPFAHEDGQEIAQVLKEYEDLDALILPSSSMSDTYDRIASIRISRADPWLLQELVAGSQYMAHTLIVDNQIEAFAASATSSQRTLKMLSDDAALASRMHDFTKTFVGNLPRKTSTHLNIRFVLREESAANGVQQMLCPVSADVLPCTPGILYGETITDITAHIIESSEEQNGHVDDKWTTDGRSNASGETQSSHTPRLLNRKWGSESDFSARTGYYSLPPSILHLIIYPVLEILIFRATSRDFFAAVDEFTNRILHGKEELFDWQDPWPWMWRWGVSLPLELLDELWR